MSIDDKKVTELPVRFKAAEEERTLFPVYVRECSHRHGFDVDESAAEVTCRTCKAKLNPMWVLGLLAHQETNYHETEARYRDEMQRLAERTRTKCQHCHQMTRISRR